MLEVSSSASMQDFDSPGIHGDETSSTSSMAQTETPRSAWGGRHQHSFSQGGEFVFFSESERNCLRADTVPPPSHSTGPVAPAVSASSDGPAFQSRLWAQVVKATKWARTTRTEPSSDGGCPAYRRKLVSRIPRGGWNPKATQWLGMPGSFTGAQGTAPARVSLPSPASWL